MSILVSTFYFSRYFLPPPLIFVRLERIAKIKGLCLPLGWTYLLMFFVKSLFFVWHTCAACQKHVCWFVQGGQTMLWYIFLRPPCIFFVLRSNFQGCNTHLEIQVSPHKVKVGIAFWFLHSTAIFWCGIVRWGRRGFP